jgi:hypothetical protein
VTVVVVFALDRRDQRELDLSGACETAVSGSGRRSFGWRRAACRGWQKMSGDRVLRAPVGRNPYEHGGAEAIGRHGLDLNRR